MKDGYHRFQIIMDFTDNKIRLPKDFYVLDPEYGYEPMAGKTYNEIVEIAKTDPIAERLIGVFWSYMLNIEYQEY